MTAQHPTPARPVSTPPGSLSSPAASFWAGGHVSQPLTGDLSPGDPGGVESGRVEPSPAEVDGVRPCGAYADHVDHLMPRWAAVGESSLRPSGSTSRWRRIRRFVLDRDGWSCQVLIDPAGRVVEAPRPVTPPRGPDDPEWLRAACAAHNLARGGSMTDAGSRNRRRPTRWSW